MERSSLVPNQLTLQMTRATPSGGGDTTDHERSIKLSYP